MSARLMVCVLLLSSLIGCQSMLKSRYAMNDPVYAEKYQEGAEKSDLPGKAKQAIDARFAKNLGGWYLSGGLQRPAISDDAFTGAEVGFEYYPTSWFSQRAALGGYVGGDQGYGGIDTGVRLQLPSRVTPFVGAGATAGVSRTVQEANHDRIDNDDDNFIDEGDEERSGIDEAFAAVYPEIGAHAWLDGNVRLTTFGKYWVSSLGRTYDDWLLGGQLTFFKR